MTSSHRLKLPAVAVAFIILFPAFRLGYAASSDTRKATVDSFLTTWLVRKKTSAALRYFHPRALNNFPVIDNTPHYDLIAGAEKNNPSAVRRALRKFLKQYGSRIRGHSLHKILFLNSKELPEQSAYLSRFTGISFNQPMRDRYWLMTIEAVKSISKPDDWADVEKQYDLRNAFVSVIQYRVLNENPRYGDDIVVMLLWVRSGAQWRIGLVLVPDYSP